MPRHPAKSGLHALRSATLLVVLFAAPFAAQSWAGAQSVPPASGTQVFLPLLNGGGAASAAAVPVSTPVPEDAPPPTAAQGTWELIPAAADADAEPPGEADAAAPAVPAPWTSAGPLFLPLVAGGQPGIALDAAEAAVSAAAADAIFADGFETGDLSVWSTRNNAAAMSVTSPAALVGSRGMQVTISSTASAYVSDERPAAEPHYRARFYFDPNSITMAPGDSHYIFSGYAGSSTAVLRLLFQYSGGSYQLRASFVDNGSTWTTSPAFTIADAPHYLELEWKAATAPGAKNGGLVLWVDGVQQAAYTSGNNDTRRIDKVRLGAISGMDAGTRGAYFIDAFESRRETYIGPAGGSTPTPTPTPIPTTVTGTPTNTPTNTPTPAPTAIVSPTSTPTSTPTGGAVPVIMAASDIVCSSMGTPTSSACAHMAVSQIIVNQPPTAVLTVGDNCHEPTVACYQDFYGPSWGRFKAITHPNSGNHDYLTTGATPYYDYFNGAGSYTGPAGDRDKGYYSFDIGSWHFVALNTQCSEVGGCSAGSPQYTWLENDLKTHPARCTLAFWHIPLFSSGGRANANARGLFTLLYNYNADVILNGHDHIYERFAPQRYDGVGDTTRGIRQFIVGTGGANHTSIASVQPNSEVRNVDTFGVLKLTLYPDRYDWQFVPVAGKTFTDSGTTYCH